MILCCHATSRRPWLYINPNLVMLLSVFFFFFFFFFFFLLSSLEPKAPHPLPIGRPSSSVRSQLWTTSLKFLSQISSNFMRSLLLKGAWKFIQMVMIHKSWWPPCPYMFKTLINPLLQKRESFGAESWYKPLVTKGLPWFFKWWP